MMRKEEYYTKFSSHPSLSMSFVEHWNVETCRSKCHGPYSILFAGRETSADVLH